VNIPVPPALQRLLDAIEAADAVNKAEFSVRSEIQDGREIHFDAEGNPDVGVRLVWDYRGLPFVEVCAGPVPESSSVIAEGLDTPRAKRAGQEPWLEVSDFEAWVRRAIEDARRHEPDCEDE